MLNIQLKFSKTVDGRLVRITKRISVFFYVLSVTVYVCMGVCVYLYDCVIQHFSEMRDLLCVLRVTLVLKRKQNNTLYS